MLDDAVMSAASTPARSARSYWIAALGAKVAEAAMASLPVRVGAFDAVHTLQAGLMRDATRSLGPSIGARACLALALQQGAIAVTADKQWSGMNVGVEVRVIRQIRPLRMTSVFASGRVSKQRHEMDERQDGEERTGEHDGRRRQQARVERLARAPLKQRSISNQSATDGQRAESDEVFPVKHRFGHRQPICRRTNCLDMGGIQILNGNLHV